MKIAHVVGARPNFMKAAPVMSAISRNHHMSQLLIHTGQHYDFSMSQVFFSQLGLPAPDINLNVGSDTHSKQTAKIMIQLETVLSEEKPDLVMVYGDVNSTMAAALVCAKALIPCAHVEAGLRSFDRTMPEEINRLVTDRLSDLLFTPSRDADENLLKEGIPVERIHLVGNVMIDTLIRLLPEVNLRWPVIQKEFNLSRYLLVTLHRPSNVDKADMLLRILAALVRLSESIPVMFPVHPRTRMLIDKVDFPESHKLNLLDPLSYIDFLSLERHATAVITDSGGVQEETTYLRVPCITVRENTERPITTAMGTNTVVGQDQGLLLSEVRSILDGKVKASQVPPLWDGKAADRIANIVERSAV